MKYAWRRMGRSAKVRTVAAVYFVAVALTSLALGLGGVFTGQFSVLGFFAGILLAIYLLSVDLA